MRPLHNARRRGLAAVGAALSAALLLTGCSSDTDGTNATTQGSTESSLLPAAEGTTQYPLTLETPWGETVLEERPERITLSGVGGEIELLAVLNANPTGASEVAGDPDETIYPWAVELLDVPVENIWTYNADDPGAAESVAESDPDLIIADDNTTKEIYDKLSSISPVLYVGEEDITWQQQILKIGSTLDLTAAAEKSISEDEEYWRQFRAQYPQFEGETLTYFVVWSGDYGAAVVNTPESASEANFTRWGFSTNSQLVKFENVEEISSELLPFLDADLIMGYDLSSGEFDELVSSPLFVNLSAVKNGAYVNFSESEESGININDRPLEFEGHLARALAGISGPLGSRAAAEAIAPHLTEALSQ